MDENIWNYDDGNVDREHGNKIVVNSLAGNSRRENSMRPKVRRDEECLKRGTRKRRSDGKRRGKRRERTT